MSNDGDAMEAEFDVYASWTRAAVEELGPDHALPAACRGSGSPGALSWLGAAMGLERDATMLDVGAGLGGPADFLTQEFGIVATLVDPAVGACRAARCLFGGRAIVGGGDALPARDDAFEHAISLGVLCTVKHKTPHLAELARVVRPGSTVGFLVYVRRADEVVGEPEDNFFPSITELRRGLDAVDMQIEHEAWLDDLPSKPAGWADAERAVDDVIARDHRDDSRWEQATSQSRRLGQLIGENQIAGLCLSARVLECSDTDARGVVCTAARTRSGTEPIGCNQVEGRQDAQKPQASWAGLRSLASGGVAGTRSPEDQARG